MEPSDLLAARGTGRKNICVLVTAIILPTGDLIDSTWQLRAPEELFPLFPRRCSRAKENSRPASIISQKTPGLKLFSGGDYINQKVGCKAGDTNHTFFLI